MLLEDGIKKGFIRLTLFLIILNYFPLNESEVLHVKKCEFALSTEDFFIYQQFCSILMIVFTCCNYKFNLISVRLISMKVSFKSVLFKYLNKL